jgi:hypothetical protein
MNTEKWSVEPDGKGAAISEATAKAHVEMAERTNRERDKKLALCEGLFNSLNWRMPTKRLQCLTESHAQRVADALTYLCGGAEIHRIEGGGYSVGSCGYYFYVGA